VDDVSTARPADEAPAPPAPGRRDPRGQRRRTELLNAAISIIGEHGIDAVTHRAVSRRAGVPDASASYYFRSKEELIDQALTLVATREVARLQELRALVEDPDRDPTVWADAIAGWIEEQLDGEGRIDCIALYHLELEAARRVELRGHQEQWSAELREMAAESMARLGASDPQRAAIVLVSAVDGLRLNALSSKGDMRGDELRALVGLLLRGLAA
jgi:TetR/AcrR family transcriptional regulator, regulator of biofilm formation and stress response